MTKRRTWRKEDRVTGCTAIVAKTSDEQRILVEDENLPCDFVGGIGGKHGDVAAIVFLRNVI